MYLKKGKIENQYEAMHWKSGRWPADQADDKGIGLQPPFEEASASVPRLKNLSHRRDGEIKTLIYVQTLPTFVSICGAPDNLQPIL